MSEELHPISRMIRAEVSKLKDRETAIRKQILEIQECCPHKQLESVNKSNTGNYDPHADSYWIEHHCHDCDKRWHEDK